MNNPKYIEYHGVRFCRDDKTGYYLNSTIRKRLHRYIWEQEVGAIPKGCHIHHIDGDKSHNTLDNLAIITASGHARLHGQEEHRKEVGRQNIKKAIQAAPAWHHSEAGKKWHSEHMQGFKPPTHRMRCEQCGAEFDGIHQSRFCSGKCKSKWRRDHHLDDVEKVCEQCGRVFMHSKYDRVRFCSKECAHKAHQGWFNRREAGA